MALDLSPLDSASRLMVEAELKVATGGGGRFQPTGFPDLGAALYRGADEKEWLLVESSQSMANRLELACWDESEECFDEVCNGIPFVRSHVTSGGASSTTSTVQESHRLASPYILDGTLSGTSENQKLWELLKTDSEGGLGLNENRPFMLRNHAGRLLQLDPSSLLHGVWLSTKVEGNGTSKKALCGGKVRFPRILSGYIEAANPNPANYGGVKRERIMDGSEEGQDAESGFGSIPFPKSDFTSPSIRAYFSIDLQLLRTLGMGERDEKITDGLTVRTPKSLTFSQGHQQGNFTNEEAFMVVWSLYKIERFLSYGLTLRSNCQFEKGSVAVTPSAFSFPAFEDVKACLTKLRNQLFPIPKNASKEKGDETQKWTNRNVRVVRWASSRSAVTSSTTDQAEGEESTNVAGDDE